MTLAQAAAAAAAMAGVAGAWDVLAAIERPRAAAWLAGALRPLARDDGGPPTAPERRRLALLASGALLAAGWIVAGAVPALLAAVAGPALAAALIARRRRRRRARLERAAAQVARALAAALGAGRPIRTAIADAATALDGPAGAELLRASGALAAGESTEAALEALRRRAGSRAWDTLIAAVLLQRDAGGDLPALLRDLAASLEAGERSERDAQAVTAQARFTARLVAGLPLVAVALAELTSPGFVAALLSNALSAVLVACALLLQATAFAAVRAVNRGLSAP